MRRSCLRGRDSDGSVTEYRWLLWAGNQSQGRFEILVLVDRSVDRPGRWRGLGRRSRRLLDKGVQNTTAWRSRVRSEPVPEMFLNRFARAATPTRAGTPPHIWPPARGLPRREPSLLSRKVSPPLPPSRHPNFEPTPATRSRVERPVPPNGSSLDRPPSRERLRTPGSRHRWQIDCRTKVAARHRRAAASSRERRIPSPPPARRDEQVAS